MLVVLLVINLKGPNRMKIELVLSDGTFIYVQIGDCKVKKFTVLDDMAIELDKTEHDCIHGDF